MYSYQKQKPYLFTEAGQVMFLQIRDRVQSLLSQASAARMQEIVQKISGDSWSMLACVDRLVELNELRELTPDNVPGQYRVFVATY